ncbi:MAG: CDP-6-deoxy-delta-3,4-glucoseen reductase [Betaproteobacteria bacterium RIFCSPLOWO2_12_FULL_63_13]|nr:MAG: CDP-6-deoxy-delta-3,4-glucoseen reductase [Betaproteobacteria bacterium RIFCSPLOWO2_02_FULL_63_19]OGA44520.1 MAG: CDP-6-deoxy-delta-3,4-glucoseen reductase [Betaproteobacteria bacterium RIFCSPLOWO2_12_FULL_63_13]
MTHQITIRNSGHKITANSGESILQAAMREGLVLPYGCRDGACGSCKGKLIEGSVDYGKYASRALSDADRESGMTLFCQARPLSDVVIEAREVRKAGDIQIRTFPCRVQRIERPTDDVVILCLKLPTNERLQFLAGQYLDIMLKDGTRRSFSMANAPHDDELLQLHIRHVAGGAFTDHVFNRMKEREILRFQAPFGTFFLREDSTKPIIFVASGTGFAPIKAIIENALAKGIARPMTLYWGGRRPSDLYMRDLPVRWAADHAVFKFVPVISDALPEDNWTGRSGFVHRAVMEDFPELSAYQVYACGVPVMVDAARLDFTTHCALPENEFYADSFTTAADRPA